MFVKTPAVKSAPEHVKTTCSHMTGQLPPPLSLTIEADYSLQLEAGQVVSQGCSFASCRHSFFPPFAPRSAAVYIRRYGNRSGGWSKHPRLSGACLTERGGASREWFCWRRKLEQRKGSLKCRLLSTYPPHPTPPQDLGF